MQIRCNYLSRLFLSLFLVQCLPYTGAGDSNTTARVLWIMYNIGTGWGVINPVLEDYARKNGISRSQLEDIFIDHINYVITNKAYRLDDIRVITRPKTAIHHLPGHCSAKGSALLLELARGDDELTRSHAQLAIVQLGGKDLFPFAREIVENTQKYTAEERLSLFGRIRYNYLGEGEFHLKPPEHYSLVAHDFLLAALAIEPDAGHIILHLDEWMADGDGNYRNSLEREKILGSHFERMGEKGRTSDEKIPRYFREELAKLRALPEKARTHIKIKTLDEVCKEVADEDANVSFVNLSAEWRRRAIADTNRVNKPPFRR